EVVLVPLAGIEPALLAELDFESSASTSSATGARARRMDGDIERRRRGGQSGGARPRRNGDFVLAAKAVDFERRRGLCLAATPNWNGMFKRLYDWLMALSQSASAP